MPTSLPYSGIGVDPRVISASAQSPFRVRVVFSEQMADDAALSTPGNYVLTPAGGSVARSVLTVVVPSGTTGYVTLLLDGALTPGTNNYELTVSNVSDLAANPIDISFDSVFFDGYDPGLGPTQVVEGLLAGLTSAVGDELNDLSGGIATRLAFPFLGPQIVQSGSGLLNASSVDAGITVTTSTGSFSIDVDAGQIFRVLSDGPTITWAEIDSVDGPNQITLLGAGIGENLTNVSWRIETYPEETAAVESTLGFPDAGHFFLDGVQYRYTSKSFDSFGGVQHRNVEHQWIDGAHHDHAQQQIVQENGRDFSGVDAFWRSILLDRASGADLDVIGTNIGVLRPPAIGDDLYREIIKLVAYSPRGTTQVIRNVLTAVAGVGNFDILEDLTGAREYDGPRESRVKHPAKVFVRVDRDDEDSYLGKTYVERGEYAALDNTLTEFDLDPDLAHPTGTALISVTVPPDPLPGGIIVARGTADFSVAHLTGSASGSSGAFPATILSGDVIRLESGAAAGSEFVVSARVSDISLTLAHSPEMSAFRRPAPGETLTAVSVQWTVHRPWSDIGRHLPSAEQEETFPFSGVMQASWQWTGTATEGGATTLQTTSRGRELRIRNSTPAETVTYRRRCRIFQDSTGEASLTVAINTAALASGATTGDQVVFQIDDGARLLRAGVIGVAAGTATIGFIDGTGAFIGTPADETILSLTQHSIRIVKNGTQTVRLYLDGREVDTVAYTDLETSAGPATTPPGILFGGDSGSLESPDIWVSRASWSFQHTREVGALLAEVECSAPRDIEDLDANGMFEVGEQFTVTAWRNANAAGGTLQGLWEIDSAATSDTGTFLGVTRTGARTSLGFDGDIVFFDGARNALLFPHARGHQIELLDGPDAGVYDIGELLGPDLLSLEIDGAGALFSAAGLEAYQVSNPGEHTPTEFPVEAVRVSNPPSGGFDTAANLRWRIIPVVDGTWTENIILANAATEAAGTVTLPLAVPLNFSAAVYEPIVLCRYFSTLSAQAQHVSLRNSAAGGNTTTHYPFYLYDSIGPVRDIIDILTAGGVIPVYNQLYRDDAGLHLLE